VTVGTEAGERGRLLAEEQAALRRVATLVASGATAGDVFAAVAGEVAHVLDVPTVMLARYTPGPAITVLASLNEPSFVAGSRWPLDGPSVSATVLETGRPARIDDYSTLPGSIPAGVRSSGGGSTAGAPIIADGAMWGVLTAGTRSGEFLPADLEGRLAAFSELVAIAISNAAALDWLQALADEQAALRRIATLIAEGASTSALGATVLEEVARVLDVPAGWLVRYEPGDTITIVASLNDPTFEPGTSWPLDGDSVSSRIRNTGNSARVDDYSGLPGTLSAKTRESGVSSVAGAPVVVDGAVWGAVCVGTTSGRLPADTETRLRDFTELVATAISNTESRDGLRKLLQEQAALHRVATLVAQEVSPSEVFAVVAEEVSRLFDLPWVELARYNDDNSGTVIGAAGDHPFPVGSTWPLDGPSIMQLVCRTERPARIEDYGELPGSIAEVARTAGIRGAIGAPVMVDGAVWGSFIAIATTDSALPPGAEERLGLFAELIATAISNVEARDDLRSLAAEQAALRRVAVLVAEGADPESVFEAVCIEAGQLIGAASVNLSRYTTDGFNETIAGWSLRDVHLPPGVRFPITPDTLAGKITQARAPARVDNWAEATSELARLVHARGARSSVGAPVIVEGRVWGALAAATDQEEPLPGDTELRLASFTDLIATAVSDSEARDSERRLLEEQAALRRVATLVAEGAGRDQLFSAVATEVAQLLHVSGAVLDRFEPDRTAVTLAVSYDPGWEAAQGVLEVGTRWPPDAGSLAAMLLETGRPERVDDPASTGGGIAERWQAAHIGSAVAAPITVDGTLWGAIRVFSREDSALPRETEARLEGFTGLVATAVSNATSREALIASRARIVAAGDEARRRIERDLHDGTQQRLIALGLDLQRVRAQMPADPAGAADGLGRMQDDLHGLLEEIRELSSSLHPPLLSRRGFVPALRALARRSPIPVDIDVELRDRPPPAIETALYYVASEALTNAIKHSEASAISVIVETDHLGWPFGIGLDGRRGVASSSSSKLYATITDDGVGGADASAGSGLSGLTDRVDALGGRLTIDSPPGLGTRISIVLPLG
jgi:GAF domain-containing protein